MDNIKLGAKVQHVVLGDIGCTTSRMEHLSGTVQYIVEATPSQPFKLTAENYYVSDFQLLDVIDDGIADRVTPILEVTPIPLGAKVRCIVTGFQGIVVIRSSSINGCVQYAVQGPAKDNVIPESHYFDYKLLEKVDDGVSSKVNAERSGCSTGTLRQPKPAFGTKR